MVYLFPAFKDMQSQIEERSDTHQITSTQDVLGEISFVEFDEFIREVHEQNMAVEVREAADPEQEPEGIAVEDDADLKCYDTWAEERLELLNNLNPELQTEIEGGSLWEDQQTQSTPADTTTKSDMTI